MRRVVVTPTFATGLGVVVAAVLAFQMHTVFDYAAPNGATCKVVYCAGSTSQGGGRAAGAGNRLPGKASGSHSGTKGSASAGGPRPPADRSGRTGSAGPAYLRYWTTHRGQGAFSGAIMIVFQHKPVPARWWLWFRYPSARLVSVQAGRALRHGPHGAIVTSKDLAGHVGNGRAVIWITVTGYPAPPPMCSFNGRPCGLVAHQGGHGAHHARYARRPGR